LGDFGFGEQRNRHVKRSFLQRIPYYAVPLKRYYYTSLCFAPQLRSFIGLGEPLIGADLDWPRHHLIPVNTPKMQATATSASWSDVATLPNRYPRFDVAMLDASPTMAMAVAAKPIVMSQRLFTSSLLRLVMVRQG
jgi:hypothetical protein